MPKINRVISFFQKGQTLREGFAPFFFAILQDIGYMYRKLRYLNV